MRQFILKQKVRESKMAIGEQAWLLRMWMLVEMFGSEAPRSFKQLNED